MKSPGGQNGVSLFISAGEQSGDMHGAELIRELKKSFSPAGVSFAGLGGDLMSGEGMHTLYHVRDLATVGFIDVIKKYVFFKKAIIDCVRYVIENKPDAVILIDYPGFNLKLAEELRRSYKGKIIYYISPQLWAWHESRVRKVKKFVDLMLVVFPFEVDFYQKYSVNAQYTGHPLTKKIKEFLNSRPPIENNSAKLKRITVMPGSRKDEIRKHLPVLLETLKLLREEFEIDVKFGIAPGMDSIFEEFRDHMKEYTLTNEESYDLILNSDVVLSKAGTSTMECSLIGTPYLIFYRTSPFNYFLLKPMVKVNFLGIVNILAGKMLVKEFIQNDFTARNLFEETKKIISDKEYSRNIRNSLRAVWDILGDKDASANAANCIKEMVES